MVADGGERAVVVAVVAVGVVQMPVNEEIDVACVGDHRMAAILAVGVVGVVSAAAVVGSAALRVPVVGVEHVLIDVVTVGVVQVPAVQIVDVIPVPDSRVTAIRSVHVRMLRVNRVVAHVR